MKYKTEATAVSKKQTFSYTRPEYKLDAKANKLVVVGTVDDFKAIQSHKDCALSAILDKFMASPLLVNQRVILNSTDETAVYDHAQATQTDLTELGELITKAEVLRAKYSLPDNLTAQQIFDLVAKASIDVKAKLNTTGGNQNETPQTDTKGE